jgi:hypothetical protein
MPDDTTPTTKEIHMEAMIGALALLTDNAGGDHDLAVRAAALDAAITHLAGEGSSDLDISGGAGAIGVARTFERYLTGADTIVIPEQELRLLVDALADVTELLNRADFDQQDDAETWAQRRDTAVGVLTGIREQLDDRRSGGR